MADLGKAKIQRVSDGRLSFGQGLPIQAVDLNAEENRRRLLAGGMMANKTIKNGHKYAPLRNFGLANQTATSLANHDEMHVEDSDTAFLMDNASD